MQRAFQLSVPLTDTDTGGGYLFRLLFYLNGKVESGTLDGSYRQISEEKEYSMAFDYISASVTYTVTVNGKPVTVTANDGGELKCDEEKYCDEVVCYDPKYLYLDIRLDESLLEGLEE